MIHAGEQNYKFIAALAAEGVRGADAVEQALSHRLEQFVTNQMPERVVDVLKLIQIQKQKAS